MRRAVCAVAAWLIGNSAVAELPFFCVPGSFRSADADGRGDVALPDWKTLIECFSGPETRPDPSGVITLGDCLGWFDADSDRDVDLVDVAKFANGFTGPCRGLGNCPPSTQLVHASGVVGPVDPDTYDPTAASAGEYVCQPVFRDVCERLDCGRFGSCVVDSFPLGACLCRAGYAGAACEECAVGYQRSPTSGACVLGNECRNRVCSGSGQCRENAVGDIVCECDSGFSGEHCENGSITPSPRPPPRIAVSGTDQSIEHGEVRRVCARPLGEGNIDRRLTWRLYGPGRLAVDSTGFCADYFAPELGPPDNVPARIEICSLLFAEHCTERFLTIGARGAIAISGQSHPIFRPFDEAIVQFMRHRCVGAAILGVNVFGKTVFVRGYGNLSGAPTNEPNYLEACGDTFDVSDEVPGVPLPNPAPVQANTPIRIGSNTKAVAAAVLRREIKKHLGAGTTDDDVEDLVLCDDPALLPAAFRNIMCNGADPPVALNSLSGFPPNCTSSNPCPLGGTCQPANSTAGVCMNCPAGLSGPDCTVSATFCPDLTDAADSRWSQVTLGHLLGHRSGMPRSVPDTATFVYPNLFRMRSLDGEADWEDQEDLLATTDGYPDGDFLDEFPSFPIASLSLGLHGYFIPRPTLHEVVTPRLGACLAYSPGTTPPTGFDNYSNTAFSLVGGIAETVSGRSLTGKEGRPGLHVGGLLEEFTQVELGLPLPGQGTDEGIFLSQSVFRTRNPKEPVYRSWSGSNKTYYPRVEDTKRPHCIWNVIFDSCDFDDWLDEAVRFDWDFEDARVLRTYSGGESESSGSAGSFATEAEVYLRFMARYWVGGQGANPLYGETRCPNGTCNWTSGNSHNGSIGGAYSWALQLGGARLLLDDDDNSISCNADSDCPAYVACQGKEGAFNATGFCLGGLCRRLNEYSLPEFALCSAIVDGDYDNPVCHACRLPAGVDLFVAINQSDDKRCATGTPDCGDSYVYLRDHLIHAACQVAWPPNPYVIWPPIGFVDGESGMGFTLGGLPEPGLGPSFSCCGNGAKEAGEQCDGDDFGTTSCASYGFEMGDLICTEACTIQTALCSGGTSLLPPGTYAACGADDCTDPSDCEGDDVGRCLGGPCRLTEPNNESGKLQWDSTFHPDGNFRDEHGNLYQCDNDTEHGEMVCIDVNGWGVCKRCTNNVGETGTRVGCSCDIEGQCENGEPGLGCFGEDYGSGPGFCWDSQDGPPFWQCVEGACGMAPYYGDDEMYCEHYDGLNHASNGRCMPFFACDGPETQQCAEENLICAETQAPCMGDFPCCSNECLIDSHCSEAFGWPPNFGCGLDLKCVYEP